ncbi:hypothetical protein LXJ59_26915, partial [Escherichia coli]|nr:hypothetical protein [Escherichia coli]
INFISKRPNFNAAEGQARVTAYNYGMKRGDFYYSAAAEPTISRSTSAAISSRAPACATTRSTMPAGG